MLSSGLCLLDEAQEITFTFSEAFSNGFNWILRKLLVLHHEVVEVISQVVCTGRATVAVEYPEETYLRPFNIEVLFVLGLQNVQNYGHTVLVVVSNDALVRIGSIGFDDATLLGAGLSGLVVLELDCLWIQGCWVLSKEESLYLNKLYI